MGFEHSDLEALLDYAVEKGAHRVHLLPGSLPLLRIGRDTEPLGEAVVEPAELESLLTKFANPQQRRLLSAGHEQELLFRSRSRARFRIVLVPTAQGLSAVFVRMPGGVPDLEALRLPGHVASFVGLASGLVLVNGLSGAGKTATLAGLVDYLNKTGSRHVVTIEQSIAFVHQPALSVIHQREVGAHVDSFAHGVRDAMDLGADVIVVSDVPDLESFAAVLDAAERGRLVLASMVASGIVSGLEALVRSWPDDQVEIWLRRLASALRVSMGQSLIQCGGTGRRVPLVEILINNENVRPALAHGRFHDLPKIMSSSVGLGMQTIDDGLRALVVREQITPTEARHHAQGRTAI